jgi:hypothetical protein
MEVRRLRVLAAFLPAARRFRVVAAFIAAVRRFRVTAAFRAADVPIVNSSLRTRKNETTRSGGLPRGVQRLLAEGRTTPGTFRKE